jgi:hypothetical protein
MATLVVCDAYPDAAFKVQPYQVQGNFLQQILNTFAAILNLKLTPRTKATPPPVPANSSEEAQPVDELGEVQPPADAPVEAQPPADAPAAADSPADAPTEVQPPQDDTPAEEESSTA